MAIDNPFNPETLKKYTSFFLPTVKAPGFPGPKPLAASLKGYRDFLGTSDYTSRLKESEDLAKMQLGLALAQRGFAAMGAQPQRGESPIGTLGRTLAAPLAGDLSTVAGRLMQQRQAAKLAEEQEERQLKLSALQDVRARQQASYTAKVGAENAARKFIMMTLKKKLTPSTDYEVNIGTKDKPLWESRPVALQTDWEGKKVTYFNAAGEKLDSDKVRIYRKPTKPDKPSSVSDVQMNVGSGKAPRWLGVPAIRIGEGKTARVQAADTGKRLIFTGKNANARIRKGSGSSYFEPAKKDVFLKQGAVDYFGLASSFINKKALFTNFAVKPEHEEGGLKPYWTLQVGNKIFDSRKHKTTPAHGGTSVDQTQMWGFESPITSITTKDVYGQVPDAAGTFGEPVPIIRSEGSIVVKGQTVPKVNLYIRDSAGRLKEAPPGTRLVDDRHLSFGKAAELIINNAEEAKKYKGLETAVPNDRILIQRAPAKEGSGAGELVRVLFKGKVINIAPEKVAEFTQDSPLSTTQKLGAGQEGLYERPVTKEVFATPGLIKLLGLPANNAGMKITRNTHTPKSGAPTGTHPYSTYTIGAVTYDPRNIDSYDAANQTVKKNGDTYNLALLTTEQNPLAPAISKPKEVFVHKTGPGGTLLKPQKVTKVIEKTYDPVKETYVLVPKYFLGGKRVENVVEVDDRNLPFGTVQALRVTANNIKELRKNPWAKDIRIGEEILVQESKGKENTGAPSQFRYIYKGVPVEIKMGQEALATGEAPDLLTYQNVSGKVQTVNGEIVKPGASIIRSPAEFAALGPSITNAFSDDSVVQLRDRRQRDFRAAWGQVLEENPHLKNAKNLKPTEDQLKRLHGMFPGTRSIGENLNTAIFNMIRLANTPPINGVSVIPTQTVEGTEDNYNYAAATEKKLKEAGKRYEALRGRKLVSEPWQSLSFIEKQAFSKIPAKGLDVRKVPEQISGSLKTLEDRRGKFKNPTADDRVVFAAAVRSLILLKSIKKGGELNQTGIIEGLFSRLGAQTFADWPVITSTRSQRLNQALTDLNASLKTISSSEAVDGRPSNFRLQLQQNVIPDFSKPETENLRNLETLISKMENAIRAHFSTALASDTVIPQSYVRMAREAGIKDVKADPRNYPWINPRAALEEIIPVTKEGVLRTIGKLKYGLEDVQALYKGRMLPPDDKGRLYQKVSDTEVQQVVDGQRVGKKYKIKDIFRPRGTLR